MMDTAEEEKMSFLVEKGRALVNHVRGEGGSSFENDDEQTCSMSERRVSLVTVTTSLCREIFTYPIF